MLKHQPPLDWRGWSGLAAALCLDGHPDGYRLWTSPHEPLEGLLEERFRPVEVDGPAHAEDTIAEQAVGLGIPVRVSNPLPGRRPEVVRHDPSDPALPGPLPGRFRQLCRNSRNDQAKRQEPN